MTYRLRNDNISSLILHKLKADKFESRSYDLELYRLMHFNARFFSQISLASSSSELKFFQVYDHDIRNYNQKPIDNIFLI